ncbi:MAG: hypothetical protein L3J16_00395 [Anaerolineales bacterium]|nr:hypothetical protein [Anaerolineales bacterium]
MTLLKRWFFVLSTSYALVFYSELLFWGTGSLSDFLETWFYYSLATYIFLIVVSRFRANTLWSLFLAGAVYGWLTEGVVVQTVYESLPMNISDTGLSWHALISVCVGWYALRRALLDKSPKRTILWSIGIGIFAGLWLPFWGFDLSTGIQPFTLSSLASLTGVSVPILALSYWLQNRLTPIPFTPHKIEIILLVGLFLLQFGIGVLPVYPFALIVLPPLLIIVLLGLRRHCKNNPNAKTYIETLAGQIRSLNLLSILLIIPASLITFAINQFFDLTPVPQYAIYIVIVPAGFLMLFVSLFKVWRSPKKSSFQDV